MTTLHLSEHISLPAERVYAFAADPANLPSWAAGLSGSIEQVDGRWYGDSPMGRVEISFAPPNSLGVLDHTVTLPDGTEVYNPMRVLADTDGSEIVFTLRQRPGVSDEELAADAKAVNTDLTTLKKLLESQ